jgi:hypothetical protein
MLTAWQLIPGAPTARRTSSFAAISYVQDVTLAEFRQHVPELNPVGGATSKLKSSLGNLRSLQLATSAGRDREEPAQAHPAPARPHHRIPRPDRTQHRTGTTVAQTLAFPALAIGHAAYLY